MYNRSHYSNAPVHFANLIDGLINHRELGFAENRNFGTASVNVREHDDKYELQLVAPGLQKEDFKIAIDKNTLTISFDQQEEAKETKDKWLRQEFKMKSFKRSFALNEKIDVNSILAVYENGVLNISLPKKEKEEPKTVSISVQ